MKLSFKQKAFVAMLFFLFAIQNQQQNEEKRKLFNLLHEF